MEVRTSREVVMEAPPEAILDALADIGAVSCWSALHKDAQVVDRHPDGRPHHVRATVNVMGLNDREVLEYHWGIDWMVWDAERTSRQRCQHGEYNLTSVGEERTRVRFDLTLNVAAPYPAFLVERAKKAVLGVALENLRRRVMAAAG